MRTTRARRRAPLADVVRAAPNSVQPAEAAKRTGMLGSQKSTHSTRPKADDTHTRPSCPINTVPSSSLERQIPDTTPAPHAVTPKQFSRRRRCTLYHRILLDLHILARKCRYRRRCRFVLRRKAMVYGGSSAGRSPSFQRPPWRRRRYWSQPVVATAAALAAVHCTVCTVITV